MSEKGQGDQGMAGGGSGTAVTEQGGTGSATATPPQYEGRQPTEAEREAGRWLDEPATPPQYEGRQPTEAEREAGRWLDEPSDQGSQPAGSGGASAAASGKDETKWIDKDTFVGPGGTPFEFQPTESKPSTPGTSAPPAAGGEAKGSGWRPEGASGPPSEGPTQVLPPDLGEPPPDETDQGSVLQHMDTEGKTPNSDDDQKPVMS